MIPSNLQNKARELDAQDPCKDFRDLFALPPGKIYLCNNSLGLPPKSTFTLMQEQLQRWSDLGVEGWFHNKQAWYTYLDDVLSGPLSRILGASTDEVVVMNSLTLNLHLLMTSFYRPTPIRYKILVDTPIFPSDLYAIQSHLHLHGYDPKEALLEVTDIPQALQDHGESIAVVVVSGVNFLTGEILNIEAITELAHQQGCLVGCDLAHAAGNIPLRLHDWKVDFAVGCSYKYLCSGPGGPGIAFVHSNHHKQLLPRLSGWWGNDPQTRFQMQLQPDFIPFGGAASWQVSTPSIIAMTPLVASLAIYDQAGMERIRAKSQIQTAFLLELLDHIGGVNITTPLDPAKRGCQLSLVFENAESRLHALEQAGVICDFRPPNVIRVTPSPLYNTYQDILTFAQKLSC